MRKRVLPFILIFFVCLGVEIYGMSLDYDTTMQFLAVGVPEGNPLGWPNAFYFGIALPFFISFGNLGMVYFLNMDLSTSYLALAILLFSISAIVLVFDGLVHYNAALENARFLESLNLGGR